ncbi:protein of unknown function [Methylorubrum extorquens]|uniref:CobN/magnesium chelatase domain-containing protein n=1 Tax=Methylorubrum extorquens TaxID=408 RepID=A0A2N9AV78_METEX|nr:protein of unknown function [Methylorubrum extorquens]
MLDPRRAGLIATAILDEAASAGLLAGAGIDGDTPMADALTALDAHLCDLGETPFRDGLHVFGRAPADATEPVRASAEAERAALAAALDGRFVAPGPAGSPSRGRLDVMPTGRNLTTLDPRALPTRAATMLGAKKRRTRWCAATFRTRASTRPGSSWISGPRRRSARAARTWRMRWP